MASSRRKREAWAEHGLEDWGNYMAAKKAKLEDQFSELAENEFSNASALFKGISIFVNGYTNPCADVLKRLMMEHGGIYHHYMRSGSTTHIIASNLPYTKIIHYRKSKNPLPLCKPEWITDSIKAKKLLDWRPYLLYSNASITQPQLQFQNVNNLEENTCNHLPPPQPTTSSSSNNLESIKDNCQTTENEKEDDEIEIIKVVSDLKGKKEQTEVKETKSNGTALCSKNEEFLTEFYNNSRLHHIATMGATFKEYVNELRSKHNGSFAGLDKLLKLKSNSAAKLGEYDSDEDIFGSDESSPQEKEPVIMHIDMDCFFVSVGLRSQPELKGFPIAVTHARGNKPVGKNNEEFVSMAEIASCSYEARKAGIKNGMFLGQALKLCPDLKTMKYDFDGYKEVSYKLYNTVASYTLNIEAVSCDEMYADVSKVLEQSGLKPLEFASLIREEIKEKTGCPVSTGFGSNKLQARLATKKAKPDGQFHLKAQDVQSYIGSINVREIPGVGYSTTNLLKKMNVITCADLQKIPMFQLQKEFGKKTGEMLFNTSRGIDNSKLNLEHVRKSISAEVNYGIRFENDDDARNFLKKLSKEISSRLMKINAKGKCITLKLMVRSADAPKDPAKFMGHGACDNFTKSKHLIAATDDEDVIYKEIVILWEILKQPADDIRGIGIHFSRLEVVKKPEMTYMMKFISKARQSASESGDQNKTKESIATVQLPETKKTVTNSVKTNENRRTSNQGGLKSFFTTKKSATVHPKANGFPKLGEIDAAVLAELPEDIKKEILNFHKNNSSESNLVKPSNELPTSEVAANELSSNGILISQQIDETVLTELPDNIRKEIIASKKVIKKSSTNQQSSKNDQPLAEDYFKQTKPGRFVKPQLPSVQDVDMEVLIELPDDIRNEILNYYKATKNKDDPSTEQNENNVELDPPKEDEDLNDFNYSFSQVDPDFLAGLSEEIKAEVKTYCLAKKKEKELEKNKKTNDVVFKLPAKAQPSTSKSKKGRAPKKNGLITANVPGVQANKTNEDSNSETDKRRSFLENEVIMSQRKVSSVKNREEEIQSHQLNFGKIKSTEHQTMLFNLVNYLFSLPMRQVKNQIETWICKSDRVNEIDVISMATFLSMLPKERRLEDLFLLMKTMHRCMTEIGSCIWHETYKKTVDHVQHHMQLEYNSDLMVPPIKCNKRECKK